MPNPCRTKFKVTLQSGDGPRWITDSLASAYSKQVWAAMEGPVDLLALVLRNDYDDDPVACRLAVATLVDRAAGAWPWASPLLAEPVASWASAHRQPPGRWWHLDLPDDEPCLDEDVEDVISKVVHVVTTTNIWFGEEEQARQYVLAGLDLALAAAVIATGDLCRSLIPAGIAPLVWMSVGR